jgi:hypothetical protein
MADETQAQVPIPDPALRRLDRFVGRWSMKGHLVDSDETTVKGETSFRWLPGGFFLEQRATLNFLGMEIESLELIGYDPPRRRRSPRPSSRTCPRPPCRTGGRSMTTP